MNKKIVAPHNGLDRLRELLVDDILETEASDICQEMIEGGEDSVATADSARVIIARARTAVAKRRLQNAKNAVAASKSGVVVPMQFTAAAGRTLLKRLASNDPAIRERITLAARNEDELSDRDVLGIMEDLRELGVLPEDDLES